MPGLRVVVVRARKASSRSAPRTSKSRAAGSVASSARSAASASSQVRVTVVAVPLDSGARRAARRAASRSAPGSVAPDPPDVDRGLDLGRRGRRRRPARPPAARCGRRSGRPLPGSASRTARCGPPRASSRIAAQNARRALDVHRDRRLVEHDQARVGHDGEGEQHPLALAAGEGVDPAAREVADAGQLEGAADRERRRGASRRPAGPSRRPSGRAAGRRTAASRPPRRSGRRRPGRDRGPRRCWAG